MKIGGIFRSDGTVRAFPAGNTIFKEGDPGDVMYVVKEGEVENRIGETVLDTVEADEIFGEMGLIDGHTRSATAVAKTDCTLVPVNQKRFTFMVQQTPFFSIQVMKVLVDRLRRTDELVGRSSP